MENHRYYGTVHSIWTNIFYVIAGIIVFFLGGIHATAPSLALIGLGYGSYMYHKHLTREFASWDWFAMYATTLSISGYLWYTQEITLVWMWTFILYMACWVLYRHINQFLLLVLTSVILFLSAWYVLSYTQLLMILLFFIPALVLRLLVEPRLINGEVKVIDIVHSIWHLLTAIGFVLFFV